MLGFSDTFNIRLMVINKYTVKCLSFTSRVATYDKAEIWSIKVTANIKCTAFILAPIWLKKTYTQIYYRNVTQF